MNKYADYAKMIGKKYTFRISSTGSGKSWYSLCRLADMLGYRIAYIDGPLFRPVLVEKEKPGS